MPKYTYSYWPRNSDNAIILTSTDEAFQFATHLYNNTARLSDLQLSHRHTLAKFEKLRPLTEDNLLPLLKVCYEIQFYRECLEEVMRLKAHQNDYLRTIKDVSM